MNWASVSAQRAGVLPFSCHSKLCRKTQITLQRWKFPWYSRELTYLSLFVSGSKYVGALTCSPPLDTAGLTPPSASQLSQLLSPASCSGVVSQHYKTESTAGLPYGIC